MFKAEFFQLSSYNRFIFRYAYMSILRIIFEPFISLSLSRLLDSTVNSASTVYLGSIHFCPPLLPSSNLSHSTLKWTLAIISSLVSQIPLWPYNPYWDLLSHLVAFFSLVHVPPIQISFLFLTYQSLSVLKPSCLLFTLPRKVFTLAFL